MRPACSTRPGSERRPGRASTANIDRKAANMPSPSASRAPRPTSTTWVPSSKPLRCSWISSQVFEAHRASTARPSTRSAALTLASSMARLKRMLTSMSPPAANTEACAGETEATTGGKALTVGRGASTRTCSGRSSSVTAPPAPTTAPKAVSSSGSTSTTSVPAAHGVSTETFRTASQWKFAMSVTFRSAEQPRENATTSSKPVGGVSRRSHSVDPKSPK
mmetsp:Transcript_92910/g.268279  ORF Transcript_92910/g.268279 Transcript_92910/m.268279 type:complete len:220 (-) Transcript_92910:57-716(-)